jgi:hypothetical protein
MCVECAVQKLTLADKEALLEELMDIVSSIDFARGELASNRGCA